VDFNFGFKYYEKKGHFEGKASKKTPNKLILTQIAQKSVLSFMQIYLFLFLPYISLTYNF